MLIRIFPRSRGGNRYSDLCLTFVKKQKRNINKDIIKPLSLPSYKTPLTAIIPGHLRPWSVTQPRATTQSSPSDAFFHHKLIMHWDETYAERLIREEVLSYTSGPNEVIQKNGAVCTSKVGGLPLRESFPSPQLPWAPRSRKGTWPAPWVTQSQLGTSSVHC